MVPVTRSGVLCARREGSYNNGDSQVDVKVTEATRKLQTEPLVQVPFRLSGG